MNETSWTPEEFARLLALPADHPDRVRAEASPAFEARRRLHDEFVTPGDALLSIEELRTAEAELARRMGGVAPAAPAAGPARVLPLPAATRAGRPARTGAWLAVAAMLVAVSALGWWTLGRGPASRTVRGSDSSGVALAIEAPHAVPGGSELRWAPNPDADAYRVVVYGADLREVARFEPVAEPRFVLLRSALPGVPAGGDVQVEVTALRAGDPLGTSPMRTVRLP